MMLKKYVLWIVTGALAAGSVCAQKKPNIVLLYIDDWAWNGSSVAMHPDMPNTSMPVVQMPNLDRMAREGMVFRNAYGTQQCAPARACVLTGQSAARNGLTVHLNDKGEYYTEKKEYQGLLVRDNVANIGLDPAVTFGIPKALAPLGYVSAHIGKWHLASDPGAHGYAVHDGDTDNNQGNTIKFNLKPGQEKPKRLTEENMQDPKGMFSITEKGIKFMEDQVKTGTPFFLQLSHYAMHAGSECTVATREKYTRDPYVQEWYRLNGTSADTVNRNDDPAVWLGMADDMDGRIGAVLDAIQELGIQDNTYVVMVSDNGYRHDFYPELTQPLHGRKWWTWEGGIRVPMIAMGPDIKAGSRFSANVVNYDFLPTFVEWAGGNAAELKDIDGVSLAPYLAGQTPDEAFVNRNLYFHYPHYRATMPTSAVISGSHKVMYFWEHPDVPMLFDLSSDVSEIHNIADRQSDLYGKLRADLMSYLKEVGARIPKENPEYNKETYMTQEDYIDRMNWGPFTGSRPLDDDERTSGLTLRQTAAAERPNDVPKVSFKRPLTGANFPAGTDLTVEVDVKDQDGLKEVDLRMNGLQINGPGYNSVAQKWNALSDFLLKDMAPGKYTLEVMVEDKAGHTGRSEISFTVGTDAEIAANSNSEIHQVILNEGEELECDKAYKFPALGCKIKLGDDGQLLLKSDKSGAIFKTDSEGPEGDYFGVVEDGQFKIYSGKMRSPGAVVWSSEKPLDGSGPYHLGITSKPELVVFRTAADSEEIVWRSH